MCRACNFELNDAREVEPVVKKMPLIVLYPQRASHRPVLPDLSYGKASGQLSDYSGYISETSGWLAEDGVMQ